MRWLYSLACLTRIYGLSEVNTAFRKKREAGGGGEKIKRRFINSPPLVSRFARNAAFTSLGSESSCYAG